MSFLASQPQVFTVSELTRHVRVLLEGDYRLKDVRVTGEISNMSRPASGHLYFTLKDPNASLRCVMWRSEVARQAFMPSGGQAVEVRGHISVYEAGGQYQLYASELRPAGEGELYRAFLELKAKLEAEGLFDPARKRPLPTWPAHIGVVTSASAAAFQDVLDVLRRRFPVAEVVLSATLVQGSEAPAGIVRALAAINEHWTPDVILLVRGGGSMEDLAAFNDEVVARAIAGSPRPVVSGVGHETDFTIADFVADVRAPTPSAAAEIVSPDRAELLTQIRGRQAALAWGLRGHADTARTDLARRTNRLKLASPRSRLANAAQRLDGLSHRGWAAMDHKLRLMESETARLARTLTAVGPPAVLARGYALVTRQKDGSLVRRASEVQVGEALAVQLGEGRLQASVDAIEPEEEQG